MDYENKTNEQQWHQDVNPNQYEYYQNLYNMFGGYNPITDKQSKNLMRLSLLGGSALIGFSLMQYAVVAFLNITGLIDVYKNDVIVELGISAIAPLFYTLVPFIVLYLIYNSEEKKSVMIFDKPKSLQGYILAVFAGLMVCFFGNSVTTGISSIFGVIGVDFSSIDSEMPSNAIGYILMVLGSAVIPALLEEFAFRGVLMQPLRKYGDRFAIIVSAVLFAIMHGNMIQIPFAFIAGLALGYFAVSTGSIWTSVTIHFLNNLISVITSIYYENHDNYLTYYIISAAIMGLGIFALIVFFKSDHIKLAKNPSALDKSTMSNIYFCSPPVAMSIVVAIYYSIAYSKINSLIGTFTLVVILAVIAFFVLRGVILLKRDRRIRLHGSYTLSIIIMIFGVLVGSYFIVFSSLSH